MRLCAAGFTGSPRKPRYFDSVVGRSILTGLWVLGVFSAHAQTVTPDTSGQPHQFYVVDARDFSLQLLDQLKTPAALAAPTGEASLKDVVALTDDEVQVLAGIAGDWQAALDVLSNAERQLVFEARLQTMQSGKASTWLADELKKLRDRRSQMAFDRIKKIQDILGDERFARLDAYVRSPIIKPVPARAAPKQVSKDAQPQ